MNTAPANDFAAGFAVELRAFLALCENAFEVAARENRALSSGLNYFAGEFDQDRKGLLPGLETALINLRRRREVWQQRTAGSTLSEEVKTLFEAIQSLLMKILLLDRENQQAMLRRGVVPVRHLPAAQAQRPHFVAGLYRRYSAA